MLLKASIFSIVFDCYLSIDFILNFSFYVKKCKLVPGALVSFTELVASSCLANSSVSSVANLLLWPCFFFLSRFLKKSSKSAIINYRYHSIIKFFHYVVVPLLLSAPDFRSPLKKPDKSVWSFFSRIALLNISIIVVIVA